ncbi:MAG: hypothetical protein KGL52_04745 [Rhodospirillales bacterium]|nr:hypothetical protein [Rhodospirillales bacterium]
MIAAAGQIATPLPTAAEQFPDLAAAVLTCRRTADEHHAAWRASWAEPHDRMLRAARALAWEGHQAALRRADRCIAAELLPALLGGAWRPARRGTGLVTSRTAGLLCWPLIDHSRTFRRAETRGATAWRNSLLITEPYGTFTPDGDPAPKALAHARGIRAEIGAGVWARPDLSPWNPGGTALVLIAAGLRPEDASKFGFVFFT